MKFAYKRIRLIDKFGFADLDKITNGLGCNLTLEGYGDRVVLHKDNEMADATVVIRKISRLVKNAPSPNNQRIVADHILAQRPTDLYYEGRSVFRILKKQYWYVDF